MKKTVALMLTLLILAGVAGCSAGRSAAPQTASYSYDMAAEAPMPAPAEMPAGEAALYSKVGSDPSYTSGGTVYTNADAKLIREANLTLESMEFDRAIADLDALVAQCGGYYSASNLWGGAVQETAQTRSADYTIRVPKEQYNAFLSAVDGVAHVVRRSESTTDVGAQYYDTELRLETARVKHDRLLSLLERADEMEDIIALENSLSQLQYEIDALSGSLRKYDGLVDYATIYVGLSEVRRLTETEAEPDTFGVRLTRAAQRGATRFGDSMAAFAEWVAYHFIGLTILLAIAAVVIVVLRRKRIFKRRNRDSAE